MKTTIYVDIYIYIYIN